ncbi:hypothetical protein TNCV_1595241 [Trichonephila clavipes]|nr:hypothetical protein TNCV_1595241 [Trichonephila clavipes]
MPFLFADMHYTYGHANGKGRAVLRMYHALFPVLRTSDHGIVQRSHRQLRETRSQCIAKHNAIRRRAVRSPSQEESILIVVPDRPMSGTRDVVHQEVLQCEEKKGNRLVPGLDYMVVALKLPNQAPRVSGESLQTCVAWRCPDGTQHIFCWPILVVSGQSLASNGAVVNSRYLILVFVPTEATHNKSFIYSPTKYTVEPSWILVLVWPPFELLHRALTTMGFAQYCRI